YGDMFQRKYYSEQTGKEVDDEIRKIINDAYKKAIDILNEHRDKLEAVTKVLLEKETIMGDEFEAIMEGEITAEELLAQEEEKEKQENKKEEDLKKENIEKIIEEISEIKEIKEDTEQAKLFETEESEK
nr:hypothetical protein [Fusobacterium sp.]